MKWFTYDRTLALLLFLAIALACGLTPMQTDTWWQLRAGRDMWASRQILLTDVYSHTAYGSFWLNHEWLAEVFYYAAYRAGGLALVTLGAAALIVGGWIVSWNLTRGPARDAFLWMTLALVPASLWWEPRPHAVSLLFLPLTVWLVLKGRDGWLPLVFLVWANCHGGVLLGLVVLATALGARVWPAPRSWWKGVLVLLACAVAMTITPLGLSFWTEIPKSLQRINLYPLDEWRRTPLTEIRLLPFWLAAIAFVALAARHGLALLGRRVDTRDAPLYATAALLLPAAVLAIRNVGPFLMLAVPAITSFLQISRTAPARVRRERPGLNAAIVSVAAVAVVVTLARSYDTQIPKLRWTPIPAGALAALDQCPDNLYNRYDEGGSLLWFAPGRKVFMDGRQDPFPPDLVLEHIRIETGQADHRPLFARFGIRCANLPTVSPVAAALQQSGWTSLYRDPHWVVLRE